jgi:DNA (cytosine-5)-methyltransferase 1
MCATASHTHIEPIIVFRGVKPISEKIRELPEAGLILRAGILYSGMKTTTHRIADLFCGPGGFSAGFEGRALWIPEDFKGFRSNGELHRFEPIWCLDYSRDAVDTFVKNTGCPESFCGKVEKCDFEQAPRPEGLLFGFPCNDFSMAGPRTGLAGKYGGLFSYGRHFIDLKDPDWFIAENVGGLKSDDGGKTLDMILEALATAGKGYELTAHYYKMETYGIPQMRHRVLIVGMAKRLGRKFAVPAPNGISTTASEALADIPENAPNHEMPKHSKRIRERLSLIPEGKNVWYLQELEKKYEMAEDVERLARVRRLKLKDTEAKISFIYKRLERNSPAYTVTGSGGGGTKMYHWSENRGLTNRERARIQTFSDSHVFCGTPESVRKQVGMAVPPLFAMMIAQAMARTLSGESYESVDADIFE